jgi:hypothetical protein
VEKGVTSFKGVSNFFNIPLILMFDNLNGSKTIKFGPHAMLSKEEKINVVDWIFGMKSCGLLSHHNNLNSS